MHVHLTLYPPTYMTIRRLLQPKYQILMSRVLFDKTSTITLSLTWEWVDGGHYLLAAYNCCDCFAALLLAGIVG